MFVSGFPKIISNRGEIAGTVHWLSPNHTRGSGQPGSPLSFITSLCAFYEDIPSARRTCPQCNAKVRKLALHVLPFSPQTSSTLVPIFSFTGRGIHFRAWSHMEPSPYCPPTVAAHVLLPPSLPSEFRFAVQLLCRLFIKLLLCKASLWSARTLWDSMDVTPCPSHHTTVWGLQSQYTPPSTVFTLISWLRWRCLLGHFCNQWSLSEIM